MIEIGSNLAELINLKNKKEESEGALKIVIGHYDAADLISNRGKATEEVTKAVADALAPQNVVISSVQLNNIDFNF